MICFGAIAPHTPVLLPQIGKKNTAKYEKTVQALELLRDSFVMAKPDIVIVLVPHGEIYPNAFSINTLPVYQANFEEFGDFETKTEYRGAISFINRLKEQVEAVKPLMLYSENNLNYSAAVPMQFLAAQYKNFALAPINHSLLDYQAHVDFGQDIKEAIYKQDQRVAVIASAELSRKLSPKGLSGFSPQAKEFDKKIIQLLKQKKTEAMVNLDQQLVEQADECGLRAILILQGILQEINYDFQVLSYESPFGTGCLAAEYKLG